MSNYKQHERKVNMLLALGVILFFWCVPMLVTIIICTWLPQMPSDNILLYKIFATIAASIIITTIVGGGFYLFWKDEW